MAGLLTGPVAGIWHPANLWLMAAAQPTTATTATATPTATSAASSAASTHTIAVGATGFTFSPDSVSANVGDIVEFNFYPGNHSVVRSAFGFPCIPYEDTGPNLIGFFSGFLNTNVYSSDGPKYRIRVNDTAPIFYYCDAPGSCIDNHMIGVINPNATWTLDLQNDFTSNTTVQISPGEPLPSEVASTTATAAPGATGSSGSGTGTSSSSTSHHHDLSGGAIAGIVVGSVAGVVLACGLFFHFCCSGRGDGDQYYRHRRRRARDHDYNRNSWPPRGRAPDGTLGGGGPGASMAMVAPVSPATTSATPASFQRSFPSGSPAPVSVSPEMVDMGGFLVHHHNPNMAAAYPTYGSYNTMGTTGTLPMYPAGMPGMAIPHPGHQMSSPLQRHPTTGSDTAPDKEMRTPSPALQAPLPPPVPPQAPVELPAARVPGPSRQALRVPPPAALKESPTMGAADDRAWGASGSNLDLSKGEK